jgi:hypothetical protein
VTPLERDNIILEAALEWGADAMYDIQPGTLGMTLYIDCLCREDATYIRQKAPMMFYDLYVVVTYPTHILTYADLEEAGGDPYAALYDPKLI